MTTNTPTLNSRTSCQIDATPNAPRVNGTTLLSAAFDCVGRALLPVALDLLTQWEPPPLGGAALQRCDQAPMP